MPELPEVEICRRSLQKWLGGRRVLVGRIVDPAAIRSRLSTRPSAVAKDGAGRWSDLANAESVSLIRHGKRIGWVFDQSAWLLHLGMTGKWIRRVSAEEPPRFARVGLELDDGHSVWFVDARRFGCVVPLSAAEVAQEVRGQMGPDALMEPMDGPSLQAVMVGRRSIKVALMDQARIAGIGNIHAVEALWRAGILPQRSCQELSVGEYGKLAISLVEQLRWTIAQEENGEIQYVSDKGSLNPFQVYGRESESCTRCSDTITSKKDSGRTTFWCPGCQV